MNTKLYEEIRTQSQVFHEHQNFSGYCTYSTGQKSDNRSNE